MLEKNLNRNILTEYLLMHRVQDLVSFVGNLILNIQRQKKI